MKKQVSTPNMQKWSFKNPAVFVSPSMFFQAQLPDPAPAGGHMWWIPGRVSWYLKSRFQVWILLRTILVQFKIHQSGTASWGYIILYILCIYSLFASSFWIPWFYKSSFLTSQNKLVGGFNPSEKIWSSNLEISPNKQGWKWNQLWNHQPATQRFLSHDQNWEMHPIYPIHRVGVAFQRGISTSEVEGHGVHRMAPNENSSAFCKWLII